MAIIICKLCGAKKTTKGVVGRPRRYCPCMCEELIKRVSEGMWIEGVAEEWGLPETKLRDWSYEIEEFHAAYARAKNIINNRLLSRCEYNIEDCRYNDKIACMLLSYNNGQLGKHKKLKIRNISNKNTNKEKIKSIWENAEHGEISAEELQSLVCAVKTTSEIEHTDAITKIHELNKLEEIIHADKK